VKECGLITITRGVHNVETIKGNKTIPKILDHNQKLSMGNFNDKDDFLVMDMSRYHVILGTKWRQNYGVVKTNFEEQGIELEYMGSK